MFARYAADHLFSSIDEMGVRDASNLVVEGYDFAPSFYIWTVIEECLNPPGVWEKGAVGSPPRRSATWNLFDFPEGIGPVECVNVEHEEVLLMPRWVDCKHGSPSNSASVMSSSSCTRCSTSSAWTRPIR